MCDPLEAVLAMSESGAREELRRMMLQNLHQEFMQQEETASLNTGAASSTPTVPSPAISGSVPNPTPMQGLVAGASTMQVCFRATLDVASAATHRVAFTAALSG